MSGSHRARALGFNHVALEVGDLEAALEFYGKIFEVTLRGRHDNMAFIDMGDQFLAIAETDETHRDGERHFGFVVDDKARAIAAAKSAGAKFDVGTDNDFHDPWGNRFQLVQYSQIQFTKTDGVLKAMGLEGLEKSEAAKQELRDKGVDID